ncbi:MAG: hypothetical protein A3J83_04870 [Elusimicrobia bacterium RIFOXYA2_FULL_40_6]|nr:MAG: hypothetical protein A3J83_04870 [Elusimicrobia bacterium RIFOXYA2_FULL_40_6]
MKNISFVSCVFLVFLSGCATGNRSAVKQGYDFTKVQTIGIGNFAGDSGASVSGEFIRQLLRSGYNVKTSVTDSDVDLILEGNVDQYIPQKQYLFYNSGKNNTNTVVVTPPVSEISGANTYSLGTPFGLGDKAEVIVSNATVGITARLVDTKTHEIVWTNSYSYESFDIKGAIESTVGYLISSFVGRK